MLAESSYLNEKNQRGNIQLLLNKLVSSSQDQPLICAVQEFPTPDTEKNLSNMLLEELAIRNLQAIRPNIKDSSVGFFLAKQIEVLHDSTMYAPLGTELSDILEAMGCAGDLDNLEKD